MIKKEAENVYKTRPSNSKTTHVECKNKSDTSNNRGNWNRLKFINKMCEHHMWKAHQRTTGKSHIVHYVHISKSTNVKVQNVYYKK